MNTGRIIDDYTTVLKIRFVQMAITAAKTGDSTMRVWLVYMVWTADAQRNALGMGNLTLGRINLTFRMEMFR